MTPAEVLACYLPHRDTIPSLLASRSLARGDATALCFEHRSWSFHDLEAATHSLKRALLARGLRKGDYFAHIAPNSDVEVILFLALAHVGAVFVPLNPALTEGELGYLVRHCGAIGLAAPSQDLDRLTSLAASVGNAPWSLSLESLGSSCGSSADVISVIKSLEGEASISDLDDVRADDTAVIIYTSGTTGTPKGVMHSQRNFVWAAEAFVGRLHLQPSDRLLTVFPLFHVNALLYSLGGALAAGATFITAARFSASTFWKLAVESNATQLNILAALGNILGMRPRTEFNPNHRIRKVYGGPISQEMFQLFQQEFGIPTLIEGYGMSEIPAACSNPFEGPQKLGSIGKPGVHPRLTGSFTELRIVDDSGLEVLTGEVGELVARTPILFQGYLHDSEQTRASLRDGWFLTGDLARADADGYLYFVARKKDIIRRRGENIAGAEIDRVLGEHPSIAAGAAIGVPSPMGDEDILVAVVPKPGKQITHAEVVDWCRSSLAAMKVPRYVVLADSLPQTPTHRVAKHLLKKDHELIARARDMEAGKA